MPSMALGTPIGHGRRHGHPSEQFVSFRMKEIPCSFVEARMVKLLTLMACLGFATAAAEPAIETWDLTLVRQNEAGTVLSKTSTTTAVVGEERELIGNFPLSMPGLRQWVIRIDLNAKEKAFVFSIREPAAPGTPRGDQADEGHGLLLFDSQQAWQGSGRYTLCTIAGERVVASIGRTGEKDLPERTPVHSVALVRRSADGELEAMGSVPWTPGQKNGCYLALSVTGSTTFQRARCWVEDYAGKPLVRLRVRPAGSAASASVSVSHDLWLTPRTDGQPQAACEQDGERLEIKLIGGIAR